MAPDAADGAHAVRSLNRIAFSATVHCLTGCAIGEVLVAGAAAFPVNRWMIGRGRGHAVAHAYH